MARPAPTTPRAAPHHAPRSPTTPPLPSTTPRAVANPLVDSPAPT
ncbi:hypothetical protein ABIE67_001358 [Streptomyces sp. V4I8]